MPGIPFEFYIFGLTLAGVAIFHRASLWVSLVGLAAIIAYKLTGTDGLAGLAAHFSHEWVLLANLFLLQLASGQRNTLRRLGFLLLATTHRLLLDALTLH